MARPVQTQIPGTSNPDYADVDKAIEQFVNDTDALKQAREHHKTSAEELAAAMREHKLTKYRHEAKIVTLKNQLKVKVATDKKLAAAGGE